MINAKTALLQALLEGEGFGLELIERVRDRTGQQLRLLQGSAYPALRGLERDGLATSEEREPSPERGGHPRVYYRITGEGRRVALQEREAARGLFEWTPEPA